MKLYKLDYLPVARQDMIGIVRYISKELQNPSAAEHLAVELTETGDGILPFPYANPPYTPIRPMKHEYRKRIIQNYMMLYWVDEETKTVTVARVVYAKSNYDSLLE